MDEMPHEQHLEMKNLLRKFGQKISQISRTWVYVYRGEGADDKAAETLLHGLRHYLDPVAYSSGFITPESIREGSWKNQTALLALGGGYDLGFINALGNDGMKHIKDYVTYTGGAYLGICAGAYFACDHIEFDKGGPLEVVGERQFKFFPGCCRGPSFPGFDYKSSRGAVASKVLYQSSPGEGVMQLSLYFNGGGTFIPPYDSFSPLKNGFIHDSISSTMPEVSGISICHKISSADEPVADKMELTQNLINLNIHNNFQPQQLEDWDQIHEHRKLSSVQLYHNIVHKNHESHGSHNCSDSSLRCDEIDKLKENQGLENKHNKVIFGEEKDVKLGSVGQELAQHSSGRQALDLEVLFRENDESHHELTALTRNYEILGCYAELAQQPSCIVKCVVGKGTAVLSSVHFEYSFCDLDPEDRYLVDIIPKLKESETQRQTLFLSVLKNLSLRTIPNKICL